MDPLVQAHADTHTDTKYSNTKGHVIFSAERRGLEISLLGIVCYASFLPRANTQHPLHCQHEMSKGLWSFLRTTGS